ncbi:MAG: hypothetical protein PF541_00485 [Prolixibacteraceae bacterium]|nr:hypothetical protein [Prolixibacteraceae bacterium]
MKKGCLLVILFVSFMFVSQAQNTTKTTALPFETPTKNIVYGNVEYYLLGGAVNISYERYLLSAKKFDFSVRGTYGRWAVGLFGMEYGDLFKMTGNMLFFEGNNHLELDLGAVVLLNDNNGGVESVLPDIFCGYTFKKPDGHFVFKAGIGFVGFVSIGMGYAF